MSSDPAAAAHTVDSFRLEFAARPPNFRTPSPPRDALEPLSPPLWPLTQQEPFVPSRKRRRLQDPLNHQNHHRRYASHPAPSNTYAPYLHHHSRQAHRLPFANHASRNSSRSSPTALDMFAAVATSPALSQTGFTHSLPDQSLPPHPHPSMHSHPPSRGNTYDYAPSYSRHLSSSHQLLASSNDSVLASSTRHDPHSRNKAKQVKVEDAELLLFFSRSATNRRDHWHRNPNKTTNSNAHRRSRSHALPGQDNSSSNIHSWPLQDPPEPQKKPRVHKGWPKGKPRGKRTTNAATQNQAKKASAKKPGRPGRPSLKAKQARAQKEQELSFLASIADLNLPPRPKSATGSISPINGSLVHASYSIHRSASVPPDVLMVPPPAQKSQKHGTKAESKISICTVCDSSTTPNGYHDLWIICNGCKKWFHTICVGFQTERQVRDVDKFYCPACEPEHGKTTFVRKSSRAHVAVDYAGLNEGQLRAPSDAFEHHFIKPIKDGKINLIPEKFPRMAPELVTAEFFERSGTIAEPIVIPAALNPRPWAALADKSGCSDDPVQDGTEITHLKTSTSPSSTQLTNIDDLDYDCVPDDGQDNLDMVMPHGLTVRRVAELLGPETPIQVIETKSQDSGNGPWNLSKWADYYEATGEKPVRNVISLEVSQTKLSRLVRRPKVVRDLDLTDQVWPKEELVTGSYPHVQYYCLMSVADCFTDFHIDFGGSSVFYHILQGKKTFFFIPPKKQHLKKYEEWCISPGQASIWLGDVTKECYRVDLSQGDTMLIPSGWIHAVWTPETSLVIGGNFLTRMHFSMQLQVNEIEKATQVQKMFRFPYFQRVMWYAVLQYLQQDPIPSTVMNLLYGGGKFERQTPIFLEFDVMTDETPEYYNARYYSQGEVEGWGDLLAFIFRSVMIAIGKIPLPKAKQDAVIRSLPTGYGDHFELLKLFAVWVAWKLGNEHLPTWAHLYAPLSELDVTLAERKPGAPIGNRKPSEPERRANGPGRKRKANPTDSSTPQQSPIAVLPAEAEPSSYHSLWCQTCKLNRAYCIHKTSIDHPFTVDHFAIKAVVSKPPVSPIDEEAQAIDSGSSLGVLTSTDIGQTSPLLEMDPQTGPPTPPSAFMDSIPSTNSTQARIKACEECRKSKRRCVHDAAGNIDPVKAMQNPVPRAFSATKRIRLERPVNGHPSNKRIKTSPADGDPGSAIDQPNTNMALNVKTTSDTANKKSKHLQSETPISPVSVFSGKAPSEETLGRKDFEIAHATPSKLSSKSPISGTESRGDNSAIEGSIHDSTRKDMSSETTKKGEISDALKPSTHTTNEAKCETNEAASLPMKNTEGNQEPSESELRSRTPSVHVQTTSTESVDRSTSPPTSPLTDMDHPSPDPLQIDGEPNRISIETPETPESTVSQEQIISTQQAQATPSQAVTKKIARKTPKLEKSASGRPFINPPPTAGSDVAEDSKHYVADGAVAVFDEAAPFISSLTYAPQSPIEETEEEESLRLARELQEQEFGLRRRRGT